MARAIIELTGTLHSGEKYKDLFEVDASIAYEQVNKINARAEAESLDLKASVRNPLQAEPHLSVTVEGLIRRGALKRS